MLFAHLVVMYLVREIERNTLAFTENRRSLPFSQKLFFSYYNSQNGECETLLLVCVLKQVNLVRPSIPYLFKVLFNIILQSASRSSNRAFSLRFSHLNRACITTCVPHVPPIPSSFL